jgi:hypothetical protein
MAGKYAFEIGIFNPDDLARMIIAAFSGNTEAMMVSRIVFDWIAEVGRKKPGEKPLCLNCDAECHDDPEWSIVVTRPYAKAEGQTVVSAICPICSGLADINIIVTDKMLELFGGGHVIAEGRA